MRRRSILTTVLVALLTTNPALADVATAKSVVEQAKDEGDVGEQADGYLGFVQAPDDRAVRKAVAEINRGRAELYAKVAERHGVDPAVVGASSFQQRFASIPEGHYYRDPGGTWLMK